jgi:hypothetical protein
LTPVGSSVSLRRFARTVLRGWPSPGDHLEATSLGDDGGGERRSSDSAAHRGQLEGEAATDEFDKADLVRIIFFPW